jgi:prolyl-tRNA synthetase
MRQSQHFGITLKDAPRDAPTTAHRLLQRAGFIRPAAAGTPVIMPFLLRVLNRLAQMLPAELNARRFEKSALPLLRPGTFGQASGAAGTCPTTPNAVFTFKDRRGAALAIGGDLDAMMAAATTGEIRSYRDFPKQVFQIAKQMRDDPRPRTPLVNYLEFLALDAFRFNADEAVRNEAEAIYRRLEEEKFDVLFDDRDARAGEKFSDSDLIGIPVRVTISRRTFAEDRLELKLRTAAQSRLTSFDEDLSAVRRRRKEPHDRP